MKSFNARPLNTGASYHAYLNDFHLFSTVHRFFSSIYQLNDQLQLQEALDFDMIGLEKDILTCQANELLDEKEIEIASRLSQWREVLENFDAELNPLTMRHHFEQLGVPDSITLEMMLSFYLSKSVKTESDRNKIDLIATWWGQLVSQQRSPTETVMPVPSLRGRIEKIYRNLGLSPIPLNEIRDTLELLEYERNRLLTVCSVRELIERQILKRLGKLKNSIGDLLFQPAILSEVVALNISLHSVFRSLFQAEQSRLSAFLPQRQEPDLRAVERQTSLISEPLRKSSDSISADILRLHLPEVESPTTITVERAELLKIVQSIHTAIKVLDQQLQPLLDRLEQSTSTPTKK